MQIVRRVSDALENADASNASKTKIAQDLQKSLYVRQMVVAQLVVLAQHALVYQKAKKTPFVKRGFKNAEPTYYGAFVKAGKIATNAQALRFVSQEISAARQAPKRCPGNTTSVCLTKTIAQHGAAPSKAAPAQTNAKTTNVSPNVVKPQNVHSGTSAVAAMEKVSKPAGATKTVVSSGSLPKSAPTTTLAKTTDARTKIANLQTRLATEKTTTATERSMKPLRI